MNTAGDAGGVSLERGAINDWPTRKERLISFDGGVAENVATAMPDRYRFWDSTDRSTPRISRGAGLSYCAASFGGGSLSIDHRRFDRILGFDAERGQVRVEAGATLGVLFSFLLSRGHFLPTQPGFAGITIGGCIAAEVHGKNHARDGCFSRQVVELEVFHPLHGIVRASPDRESDLFNLTCGGYGLTGNILAATLQARKVSGLDVNIRVERLENIADLPAALENRAATDDFVYSWHDFRNPPFGTGFVVSGSIAKGRDGSIASLRPGLTAANRGRWRLPLWNRITTSIANRAYRGLMRESARIPLDEAMFPMNTRGKMYFGLFGGPGFCEYQAIVPRASFNDFVEQVRRGAEANRVAVTLASAKLFCGQQRLLRFSGDGICFAINVPRDGGSDRFLEHLDRLAEELCLLPNIIKDSRIGQKIVARAYPEYDEFRTRLSRHDPKRLYQSELSRRLGL